MKLFGLKKPKVARSPEWPKYRKQWLKLHPFCAVCGESKKLEVHHILPVHWDPSRELDPTNYITLCEQGSHNDHFLFGHLLDWKSMNAHVTADAAIMFHEIMGRPYLAR